VFSSGTPPEGRVLERWRWIVHWMTSSQVEESYGWATAPMTMRAEDYFRRQCWISYDPGERTPGPLGDIIGSERFIWASDFPHSDAQYPGVVDELREHNGNLEPDARAGLFGRNALESTASRQARRPHVSGLIPRSRRHRRRQDGHRHDR
jgi:hypothetical protein